MAFKYIRTDLTFQGNLKLLIMKEVVHKSGHFHRINPISKQNLSLCQEHTDICMKLFQLSFYDNTENIDYVHEK
jgi:hypothetical protein